MWLKHRLPSRASNTWLTVERSRNVSTTKLLGFHLSESPGYLKLQLTSGQVGLAGQNQGTVTGELPAVESFGRSKKPSECQGKSDSFPRPAAPLPKELVLPETFCFCLLFSQMQEVKPNENCGVGLAAWLLRGLSLTENPYFGGRLVWIPLQAKTAFCE